eukprot:IDg13786t1
MLLYYACNVASNIHRDTSLFVTIMPRAVTHGQQQAHISSGASKSTITSICILSCGKQAGRSHNALHTRALCTAEPRLAVQGWHESVAIVAHIARRLTTIHMRKVRDSAASTVQFDVHTRRGNAADADHMPTGVVRGGRHACHEILLAVSGDCAEAGEAAPVAAVLRRLSHALRRGCGCGAMWARLRSRRARVGESRLVPACTSGARASEMKRYPICWGGVAAGSGSSSRQCVVRASDDVAVRRGTGRFCCARARNWASGAAPLAIAPGKGESRELFAQLLSEGNTCFAAIPCLDKLPPARAAVEQRVGTFDSCAAYVDLV